MSIGAQIYTKNTSGDNIQINNLENQAQNAPGHEQQLSEVYNVVQEKIDKKEGEIASKIDDFDAKKKEIESKKDDTQANLDYINK